MQSAEISRAKISYGDLRGFEINKINLLFGKSISMFPSQSGLLNRNEPECSNGYRLLTPQLYSKLWEEYFLPLQQQQQQPQSNLCCLIFEDTLI